MSHDITSTDNFGRAHGSRRAWHGLGVELPAAITTAVGAGEHLDILWPTRLEPVYCDVEDGTGSVRKVPVDGLKAQVRGDIGTVLGPVSDLYGLVSNREIAQLADATGLPCETAGTLSAGRRVFFLMKGPQWDAAPGDTQQEYVLACATHAALGISAMYPTGVRVVCGNTYRASMADAYRGLSIRHTGDVAAKIAQAGRLVEAAAEWHKSYRDQARTMVARQLASPDRLDLYTRVAVAMFGDPAAVVDIEDRAALHERIAEATAAWIRLLDAPTNDLPSIRGSVWQALQTITEWSDTQRVRGDADARATAKLFGTAAVGKEKAHQLALAMV